MIDVSPVVEADSSPYGLEACKLHFEPDGALLVISAEGARATGAKPGSYRMEANLLRLAAPGEEEVVATVAWEAGNRMRWLLPDERWRLFRRLEGGDAPDRPIEPRSLAVLRENDPARQLGNLDVSYDPPTDESVPTAEQVQGVWELNWHSRMPSQSTPPYGFTSLKFVLTDDGQFLVLGPLETTLDVGNTTTYSVSSKSLTVILNPPFREEDLRRFGMWHNLWQQMDPIVAADRSTRFTASLGFNRWGQMEWAGPKDRVTLRRICRSCARIPRIPAKIALLER